MPDPEVVSQFVVGELDRRRGSHQQMQEQQLAVRVRWWCFQPCASGAFGDVEDVEADRRGIDTAVLYGLERTRVGKNVGGYGLVASDQPLAGEVLLKFERLGGEGLGDAADTAMLERGQPAEVQLAFLEIALPDALVLDGEQQARFRGQAEFFEQQRGKQRQREYA